MDSHLGCDRRFFRSVYRIEALLAPSHHRELRAYKEEFGITVSSLRDWKEVAKLKLEKVLDAGAVALKCGLAYTRSLRFNKVAEAEAEIEFYRFF